MNYYKIGFNICIGIAWILINILTQLIVMRKFPEDHKNIKSNLTLFGYKILCGYNLVRYFPYFLLLILNFFLDYVFGIFARLVGFIVLKIFYIQNKESKDLDFDAYESQKN